MTLCEVLYFQLNQETNLCDDCDVFVNLVSI